MSAKHVIDDLADPDFGRLFTDVQSSWFRLETLQHYDVPYEHDEFAAFSDGRPVQSRPGPWQAMIRDHIANGRHLERVHVIEEPPSDYIRYELHAYQPNLKAGEDIRIVPVARGTWPTGVPWHDYWLFDDERLWLMDYTDDGSFRAATLINDPTTIREHRDWRDVALAQSVPLADYAFVPELA